MATASPTVRSKVASLPDDLRSVAEAMLREKFPELYKEPDLSVSSIFDLIDSYRYQFIHHPDMLIVSPKMMHELKKSPEWQYHVDMGSSMDQAFGMEIQISPYADKPVVMKSRNYGKSYFQQMYLNRWEDDE